MSSLADRLAPQSGQARPSSAGRGGRPAAPARTSSTGGRASPRGQQRAAPYTKSFTSVPSSSSNGQGNGNVDGKWEHDLFGQDSDSLAPQLNTSFGKAKRSTSGNVFTKALDGLGSSSLNARASARSPPLKSPSGDLFGRFGLDSTPTGSGSSSPANTETAAREREERLRQKAQWEAQLRQQDEQKRLARLLSKDREMREQEEQRRREELLRQEALDLQVARRQTEEQEQSLRTKSSQSTLVVVQNLVDGTTPEDVKAALGDFGEILSCQVLESNGDTVSMQLEFINRADAETAVKQLDGALADGKTLRLSIKERPKLPTGPRAMGIPLKGTKTRQDQNVAPAHASNAPASRSNQEQPRPVEMQMDVLPPSDSKLRSDRIATYDERATILDRPPQQHFAKRNAPRFNGNHQAGKGPLQDTASLAQRFGVQVANQDSSRQVRPSTQMPARGQGQARSRLDTSSLLGRLGGAARRDEDMMDTS